MQDIYLDFDIALEYTDDGCVVRVRRSPAGEAVRPFHSPFSGDELGRFWGSVSASPETDPALLSAMGERLFRSLFVGDLAVLWRDSLNIAYRNRQRLRLRLAGTDEVGLTGLPWEYLYDPVREEFLALSVQSPLSRHIHLRHRVRALSVGTPLRVLVILAQPVGHPSFDANRVWLDLVDTVDYLAAQNKMMFERLAKPTLFDLQRRLRTNNYHILHFMGHAVGGTAADGALLLEDEAGRGRSVSGNHLGLLLRDHYSVRLALLSSGADEPDAATESLHRVAQSVVRREIPAAVAIPYRLPRRERIAWLHELYAAMAEMADVDIAVTMARNGMAVEVDSALWGLPVLYSRVEDGRLFDDGRFPREQARPKTLHKQSLLARVLGELENPRT